MSPRSIASVATALCLHAGLAACTAQAGHNYQGEPLLSMHGQATINALTGSEPVVPALCIYGASNFGPQMVNWSKAPTEVMAAFAASPSGPDLVGLTDRTVYLVDVDSQGEFPARFDVSVYVPPPDEAVVAPFEGEPRHAEASICAARSGHGQVAHSVQGLIIEGAPLESNGTAFGSETKYYIAPVSGRYLRTVGTCADQTNTDCPVVMSDGDPNLQYEHVAEQVVGVSTDLVIEYLAEPAPAGSFTAWVFGAPAGLSAGYHVFRPAPSNVPIPAAELLCLGQATNARNTALMAQFGDKYDLSFFPYIRAVDNSISPLPKEVTDAGSKAFARSLMALCATPPHALTPLPGMDQQLSIQINETGDPWSPIQ